jgi:protein-S-isoprenylcysteine O-methyltransferase Ste14
MKQSDKEINFSGVGPKIGIITFAYLLLIYLINFYFKNIFYYHLSNEVISKFFWVLLVVGLILWAGSFAQFMVVWRKGQLATKYFYAVFLNPIYASWIFFFLPALSFYFNSWLFLTGSIIFYFVMKKFIKIEEKYLHLKFGQVYDSYRKSVLIKV